MISAWAQWGVSTQYLKPFRENRMLCKSTLTNVASGSASLIAAAMAQCELFARIDELICRSSTEIVSLPLIHGDGTGSRGFALRFGCSVAISTDGIDMR
jgi:hypothetical protein